MLIKLSNRTVMVQFIAYTRSVYCFYHVVYSVALLFLELLLYTLCYGKQIDVRD
jgi:hypothetical protein